MKLDAHYSSVLVCPNTYCQLKLPHSYVMEIECPHCNTPPGTLHGEYMNGKWWRPSIIEWVLGERKHFIPEFMLGDFEKVLEEYS